MYVFNKTSIGYNHIKENKCCQDFSSSYSDLERTIITCCDAHGGKIYFRSNIGSKFASDAIMNVFKNITPYDTRKFNQDEYLETIKINILCEWNRMVETHLAKYKLTKKELLKLNENEFHKLLSNTYKAYGSTMMGALLIGNKALVVKLGDGEVALVHKNDVIYPFQDDDEPVGNITNSLCEEDAYDHIKIKVFDFNKIDGIMMCTDGMINPYQNYNNFTNSMVKPLIKGLNSNGNLSTINLFVDTVGLKLGIGDDVSLSFIIKNKKESKIESKIKKGYTYAISDFYKEMYDSK
jgi:serine/threonine protein phosphatase PrpC